MAGVERNPSDNAVKLLFAEDLVSHVMSSYDASFDFVKTAESFRNVVYNAFNEDVRRAVDFLAGLFREGNALKFEILEAVGMNREDSFQKVAEHLGKCFFSKGFEARKFLYYCSYLSSMAGVFRASGAKEAPNIAVDAISEMLSAYPMHAGAWETVNKTAKRLSRMATDSDRGECPMESLATDHDESRSPPGYSPESSGEVSEEDPVDFERGVLKYISLGEFLGIDVGWKNMMLPLLTESVSSSSDESNEERQLSD